jgi:hypothetical protein
MKGFLIDKEADENGKAEKEKKKINREEPLCERFFANKNRQEVIDKLKEILRKAWSKETSADPENWSNENPAYGQCAVTALIVNDIFGGKIVWAEVDVNGKKVSHYFNVVEGEEIDLTREQFPKGTIVPKGVDKTKGFPSTRDYILSYESTRKRYEILKKRFMDVLEEGKKYI